MALRGLVLTAKVAAASTERTGGNHGTRRGKYGKADRISRWSPLTESRTHGQLADVGCGAGYGKRNRLIIISKWVWRATSGAKRSILNALELREYSLAFARFPAILPEFWRHSGDALAFKEVS